MNITMKQLFILFILLPALSVGAQERKDTTIKERDLNDVVVVAKKDIVKSDGGKLSYNMSEDKSSRGATLLDALRKVPMVAVNGDDKITIKGSEAFKIYVNGKPNPMLEANYSTIFKSMPADAISKIEVITEPGAKYDAEGAAGILNLIINDQQSVDGTMGSIQGYFSNQMQGGGVNISSRRNTLSLDANVNYSNGNLWPRYNVSKSKTINDNNKNEYTINQIMEAVIGSQMTQGSLNVGWEPTKKDLITFGGDFNIVNASMPKVWITTKTYNFYDRLNSNFRQTMDGSKIDNLTASGNVSYQHKFNDEGENLIFMYLFNYGDGLKDLVSKNNVLDEQNFVVPYPEGGKDKYILNYIDNINREHTFQADYSKPFADGAQLLEFGGKAILRNNYTNGIQRAAWNKNDLHRDVLNGQEVMTNNDVRMSQLQDIYAAYGAYQTTINKWVANAGLRYEFTRTSFTDYIAKKNSPWTLLHDVVPNAALTYMLGPTENIRLAYQMRIARPMLEQMSPFNMAIINNNVSIGNPDLKSDHNNKISLTYSNYAGEWGGNISGEYSLTDNAITQYIYWKETTLYSTFKNIGRNQQFSLTGYLMHKPTPLTQISLSGNLSYIDMQAQSLSNSGVSGYYNVNINHTFPLDINAYLYGGQGLPTIMLQGKGFGWYYYGLGLSRDFLQSKRLQVALNATNFMQRMIYYNFEQSDSTHTMNMETAAENWNVRLSLTWKFGNLKVKSGSKVSKKIENDDKYQKDKNPGGFGL